MKSPAVGVGGLIIRPDGRVLVVRRAHPPGAGSWSLPGGKVRPGERLQEALRREMLEETGLSVLVGPLLDVVEVLREGFHYVVIDYLCTPLGDADMARASDDASELRWVTEQAAQSEDLGLTPEVLRVIDRGLTAWSGTLDEQD